MSNEEEAVQRCFECSKTAPATETNYTLISKTHGWRLERRKENGVVVLEWRCPDCWQRFKARSVGAPRAAAPSNEAPSGASKPSDAKTPRRT